MHDKRCPRWAAPMGTLAANVIDAKGQIVAAVLTKSALKIQTKVDFAAILSSRFDSSNSPTDSQQVTVREAQGVEKPSRDGDQSRQTAGPPARRQDVAGQSSSIATTAQPGDGTPSTIAIVEVAAFQRSSTPDRVTLNGKPQTRSVVAASKQVPTNLSAPLPTTDSPTPTELLTSAASPKSTVRNCASPAESRASLTQPRTTQHSAVTQQPPAIVTTILEELAGEHFSIKSHINKGSKAKATEVPALLHDGLARLELPQASAGVGLNLEDCPSLRAVDLALSQATTPVVNQQSQTSSLPKTNPTGKRESGEVPGPPSDQVGAAPGAIPVLASDLTNGPVITAPFTSQYVVAESVPPATFANPGAPSRGLNVSLPYDLDAGRSTTPSTPDTRHVRNGTGSALGDRAAWSSVVSTPTRVQAPPDEKDLVNATNTSGPEYPSSDSAIKTATLLSSTVREPELQTTPRLTSPNSAGPRDKNSEEPLSGEQTPFDPDPGLAPLNTARDSSLKQAQDGFDEGLSHFSNGSVTAISSRYSGEDTGIGNDGTKSGMANPSISGRSVGAEAPTQPTAAHSETQSGTGLPRSAMPQQVAGAGEPVASSNDRAVPVDNEAMTASLVPDYTLTQSFGSTKVVSSLNELRPVSSGRSVNSQAVSSIVQAPSGNAPPFPVPNLLAHASVQTQDEGGDPPVRDVSQPEATGHKSDADATPGPTKEANAKSDLPKTTTDSPTASQLNIQGMPQAGRVAPPAVGEPQGRAEAANTSLPTSYQAELRGSVSSARITQQTGSAEMQVKLHTESLGPIDVRTIVKGSDIGASIRVEARETQVMMANEISRLEQALSERSLRVQRLDVLQGSVTGSQSGGAEQGNYQGNPSQSRSGSGGHSVFQPYPTLAETPPVYDDGALDLSTTRVNLRV